MKRMTNASRLVARTLLITLVTAAVTAGCVYHHEVKRDRTEHAPANDNKRL